MKRILLTMLSAMVVFALVACGSNKVDKKASEKYITKAEEIVSLLNEGKYKEVHAKFDNQMKAGLPEDKMTELTPLIEKSGKFEKIDKSSVEEKDGLYVVILVAKYSKETRVFTVSFNDKEEVAGLFIK